MTGVALIPCGSYEYHGPLLPFDTDIRLAHTAATVLADRHSQWACLPGVSYGVADEHSNPPNAASVQLSAYIAYICDLLRYFTTQYDLVVLVNGHGGNRHALAAAAAQHNYTSTAGRAIVRSVSGAAIRTRMKRVIQEDLDAHAGTVESSLMAAIDVNIAEGVYSLASLGGLESPRGSLELFSSNMLSKIGIITPSPSVTIDRGLGRTLWSIVIETLTDEVNATLDLIAWKNGGNA